MISKKKKDCLYFSLHNNQNNQKNENQNNNNQNQNKGYCKSMIQLIQLFQSIFSNK